MNISTYEARIAALEAQLGPGPGPIPETGLVSAVVTPDITLDDGTTINSKLAALMPIVSGDDQYLQYTSASPLTESANYTITITPVSNWYAGVNNEIGALGEPVSVTTTIAHGQLTFVAVGVEDAEDESTPFSRLEVRVRYAD